MNDMPFPTGEETKKGLSQNGQNARRFLRTQEAAGILFSAILSVIPSC
jgi:hypothetical protein